jgi:hypothetical protein
MNVCEYVTSQNRYEIISPTRAPNVRSPVRHQFYQILRKAKFYLRIQPDFDPILDQGDEVDVGNVRRPFCRVFRDVWLGLKSDGRVDFRQNMLQYWREAAEQPVARLALDYGCHLIGVYEQPSRTFAFNLECVELALAHGQLANLIAHEIGHAWHDTQDHSNIRIHGPDTAGSEQEANDIATQWGYNMAALEVWRDTNRHQIGIFTGHIPRPIPIFDTDFLEGV